MSSEKIEKLVSLITELQAIEIEEEDRMSIMRPFYDALHPLGIDSVQFRTYQPSFNDGDPCTPSVLDSLYISISSREAREVYLGVIRERDAEKGWEAEYDEEDFEYILESSEYMRDVYVTILTRLGMAQEAAQELLGVKIRETINLLDMMVNNRHLEINARYTYRLNLSGVFTEYLDEYYGD